MPRGQIVIKSWESKAGVCFTLQLVAKGLPSAAVPVDFFRTVVHSEMPSEKSIKALYQFFWKNWYFKLKVKGVDESAKDDVSGKLAALVDCAVEYYDCEPECKEKLSKLFAEVRRGKWDESFAQLRKALEKSKSETTLKLIKSAGPLSCYFDLNLSDARPNSIADPFFSLEPTKYAWNALEWMMKEIIRNPGVEISFSRANTPELWRACVCISWAQAVLSDMLLQLGSPENREAVWKKLGEMGIEFDEMLKKRMVSYLHGRTFMLGKKCPLTEAARDPELHWKYNKEAFELARHQWTEKWADLFAVNFNQSKQGMATYKSNGGIEIHGTAKFGLTVIDGPAGEVLEWIRYNTHYARWYSEEEPIRKRNPHFRFIRHLGEYCKVRWADDVHKELEEYSRSLRSPGSDQSQEDKTKEFEEKIGSLGLSFAPAAISVITQHLQRPCSQRPKHQLGWRRPPIKLLASHKFEVDPEKVSQKNATYIKAALGKASDDEDCKFCASCACEPDDSCFYRGTGSFTCLQYAIDNALKSGIFFQDSTATTVDECGENRARRLQTVSTHTPLPALKRLRMAVKYPQEEAVGVKYDTLATLHA